MPLLYNPRTVYAIEGSKVDPSKCLAPYRPAPPAPPLHPPSPQTPPQATPSTPAPSPTPKSLCEEQNMWQLLASVPAAAHASPTQPHPCTHPLPTWVVSVMLRSCQDEWQLLHTHTHTHTPPPPPHTHKEIIACLGGQRRAPQLTAPSTAARPCQSSRPGQP